MLWKEYTGIGSMNMMPATKLVCVKSLQSIRLDILEWVQFTVLKYL
jgi:hypothetical protein